MVSTHAFALALGILACRAARFNVSLGKAKLRPKLPRLRAFNATEFRLLRAGAQLPLESPASGSSFAERRKIFPWLTDYLFGATEEPEAVAEEVPEEEFTQELPEQWRSHLQAVKKLGEGGYGKVFKCKVLCGSAEDYVTVKLVAEKSDDVLREIELMEEMSGVSEFCLSSLGSPTIPSFVDAPEGYWIMMPLMNGGELYELMTSCDRHLGCGACEDWFGRRCWTDLNPSYTTAFMLSLFRDAVKGVAAFHAQTGFLHADLKPENVMLNCRGTDDCFAAVIDFGLACDMKDPEECAYAGTPAYVPPEVYLSSPVAALGSPKRDVWALGVILYELTYQSVPPFAMEDGSGDLVTAYDPATDNNFPQPPTALDQLIIQMLALNYTERPTLNSIETMLKDIILEELKAEDERDERKVLAMLDETPTERGASVAKPKCLSQSDAAQVLEANPELKAGKQHHRRSSASGSEEAKREHCTDTPRPFANIRKCGMKRQGKRRVCCVCHVERGGKIVNAHFPMMDECL